MGLSGNSRNLEYWDLESWYDLPLTLNFEP
jgi:hypothetical protein